MSVPFEQLIMSIAAAIVYGVSGYLKNKGQAWDMPKFLSTILVGVVVGVVQIVFEIPYDAALTFIASAGVVVLVENLVKAVYRRVKASSEPLVAQPTDTATRTRRTDTGFVTVDVFSLMSEVRRSLTPQGYTELLVRLAGDETK